MALPVDQVRQLAVQSRVRASELERLVATLESEKAQKDRLSAALRESFSTDEVDPEIATNAGIGDTTYEDRQIAKYQLEAAEWRRQAESCAEGVVWFDPFFLANADFMSMQAVQNAITNRLFAYSREPVVTQPRAVPTATKPQTGVSDARRRTGPGSGQRDRSQHSGRGPASRNHPRTS